MRRDRPGIAVLILLCLITFAPALAAQTEAQQDLKDPNLYIQLLLRWMHLLFGILWIGHLYFFNFVQGGFEGKLAAEMKKSVIPELRPRALYWFRWGAMWTWVTGIFLLAVVYWMGMKTTWSENKNMGYVSVALIFVAFFVYDVISKKLGAMTPAGIGANLLLLAAMIAVFAMVGKMNGRSLLIHTGGLLGTTMAMNVWMRIWPNQRKIITAIKNGTPPEAPMVALAGARSRHNTYMSVPLLFLMVSNHYPALYNERTPDMKDYLVLAAVLVLGFVTVNILYKKAGKVTGF